MNIRHAGARRLELAGAVLGYPFIGLCGFLVTPRNEV